MSKSIEKLESYQDVIDFAVIELTDKDLSNAFKSLHDGFITSEGYDILSNLERIDKVYMLRIIEKLVEVVEIDRAEKTREISLSKVS